MNIRLVEVTEENFMDVVKLKSDKIQEERIQIFERWVGSNAFFLGLSQVYGFIPKAIYDEDTLIGFTSYGYRIDLKRYDLVSIMLGHASQGKGYGKIVIQMVIDEMIEQFDCEEIYLSVIEDNINAIKVYEQLGFKPTGEVEQGNHPEPVYCLKIRETN